MKQQTVRFYGGRIHGPELDTQHIIHQWSISWSMKRSSRCVPASNFWRVTDPGRGRRGGSGLLPAPSPGNWPVAAAAQVVKLRWRRDAPPQPPVVMPARAGEEGPRGDTLLSPGQGCREAGANPPGAPAGGKRVSAKHPEAGAVSENALKWRRRPRGCRTPPAAASKACSASRLASQRSVKPPARVTQLLRHFPPWKTPSCLPTAAGLPSPSWFCLAFCLRRRDCPPRLRGVPPRDSNAVTRSVWAPCARSSHGEADWLAFCTSTWRRERGFFWLADACTARARLQGDQASLESSPATKPLPPGCKKPNRTRVRTQYRKNIQKCY